MNSVIDAQVDYFDNLPSYELLYHRHIRTVNVTYPGFFTGRLLSFGKRDFKTEKAIDEQYKKLNDINLREKIIEVLDRKLKNQ